MMAPRQPGLSETELEVLKALWELGSGTVRELNELLTRRGRRWAYTTVLTLVGRLQTKGYVASDTGAVAHVFRPLVSREELLRLRLTSLADDLCGGTATPLVHALVEGGRLTSEEIAEFRRLLDDASPAPESPRRQRAGKRKPKR